MSADQPPNRLISIAGVIILCVAIGVVLFSGASSVTRESIDRQLQQFAEDVAQGAAVRGREGRFTYGAIRVEGWGYNKYAVIENLTLEIAQRSLLDTRKWSFSTREITVMPDKILPQNLIFVFSQPINVIENSQLTTTLTFPAPLKLSYFDGYDGGVRTVFYKWLPPERIWLDSPKNADAQFVPYPHIEISYAPRPVIQIINLPDTGERRVEVDLRDVSIKADEGLMASVAAFSSHFQEKQAAGERPEGQYTLTLSGLSVPGISAGGKPYTFVSDLTYTGDLPARQLEGLAPGRGHLRIKLHQWMLSNDVFKLSANGTLQYVPEDPLPSGKLNVTVDDAKTLLADALLGDKAKTQLEQLLVKATGKPVAEQPIIALPITREKNSQLMLGNVAFDDVAATLLEGIYRMPGAPAPAPVPPPTQDRKP